jgi:hypothetical protein
VFSVLTCQQIFYETTAEVGAGEELLLGLREPLHLDMFGESTNTSEDRSDRETGEWYHCIWSDAGRHTQVHTLLFVVYLTALSVAETTKCRMIDRAISELQI